MLKWLQPKTVYVPIVLDSKTYDQKWNDRDYLNGLKNIATNEHWKTELLNGLSMLRNAADKAKTPDELIGYNAGIAAIKAILTAPERARLLIRVNEENE